MDKMSQSHRIENLDVARGFCILLVVLGHELTWEESLRYAIYSFHIPMFFILSGMVAGVSRLDDDFRSYLRNQNKHLLFSYIKLSLIYLVHLLR